MVMRRRFSAYDKKIVAARQKWRCNICGELLDETYEVDHVLALHLGGADELWNAQAICTADHAKKTVAEEAARLRRLRVTTTRGLRAPVVCTACRAILSPFFVASHKCADDG